MNPWSADLLEFEDLRELLMRFVPSPLGRARLAEVGPQTDRAAIEEQLAETAEAIAYLDNVRNARSGGPSRLRFSDLPDVEGYTGKLRIEGVVLDGKELYDLAVVLGRAAEAKSFLTGAGPRLAARVAPIPDLRPALRELDGKLMPDGSVADDASVALARLRRAKITQQQSIRESLDRFVKSHKDDGVLQETFVTVRNDRFVVPIVSGQRRRVDGVIHGASGTGQTMYLEPIETIELNNELVRINEEELREVHRILRELTASLRAVGPGLPGAVAILGELELIFGKAEYAVSFDCVIPRFTDGPARRLSLRGARHPLLAELLRRQKKPIVPVHLEMEEPARTLLITGPNTGGKTVAMKTVGLVALMAQSGLPVPCGSAELPVFHEVLADIGDNQSIAESLSSFSAHARRLGEIVDGVTRDSLVLLDELGRATDPEEGGALGVAVVDELRQTGAFTLASTHLLALKVYGSHTPGVLNASMGFDEETLTPTYVLRTGAPGRSAGLAIASRLGLPPRLLDRARQAMSSNERDIAVFLRELHVKLEQATEREEAASRKLKELAERERLLEETAARKEAQRLREIERRSEQLMADLEARSRAAIEEIRTTAEQRKAADQAQLKASKALREMKEQTRTVLKPSSPATASAPAGPKLEEGARVRLNGVRDPARVRRLLANGRVEVEAGFLKMQIPESDILEILPPGEAGAKLPKNVSFQAGPSWTVSQREVNVLGRTAEEAREEIDRFLDRASLASVDRVRIVHGHGMGVLRRTVAELLNGHPLVDRFERATDAEGGSGATIVWLRQ